jgi:hypothetical protein
VDDSAIFDWDELLLLVEDRAVIPVVGRELLVRSSPTGELLMEHDIAQRLAQVLSVPREALSEKPDVNEVAMRYLEDAGVKAETRKRLIQKRIEGIINEEPWPIPEPLRKLAAITDFDLFLSTTSDSLLRRAIDAVRFEGTEKTQALAYYTRRSSDDIPTRRNSGDAYVYQVFGPFESSIDFAVTDEDRIETLHRLQDARLQPPILFDELREKNLLFLGCGLPDGLARILVRTLSNKRLFGGGARNKVADNTANSDAKLGSFLRHCGAETYLSGDAKQFVDALHEKWAQRSGSQTGSASRVPGRAPGTEAPAMTAGSIFLSYKSSDMDRVARLKDALEREGLTVWFDKQSIQGGDDWDQKIEKGIETCTLFIPVISRNSQTAEGEFRREWLRALRRAERIPREVPFILATLIEPRNELLHGESPEPILIPKEFWEKQTLQCLAGDSTEKFAQTVKAQLKTAQLLRGGLS